MNSGEIELDLGRPWHPQAAAVHGRRPTPRRWLAFALALLVLATVAGSAPRPRWEPVLVGDTPGVVVSVGVDDVTYQLSQAASGSRLIAYRPGRVEPLWNIEYGLVSLVAVRTGDPGLIAVSGYQNLDATAVAAEMRDARSGALLWRRAGLVVFDVTGEQVILTNSSAPIGGATPAEGVLQAVDRRTGALRWSRSLSGAVLGAQVPAPPGGPVAVEVSPDGRLRLSDLATNAQRHTVRLALLGTPTRVTVRDGVAVVNQLRPPDGSPSIAGYNLVTGVQQWRLDDLHNMWPCGERYLCVYGSDVTSVLDPTTGTTVYRGPGGQMTFHGDRLLVWQTSQPGEAGPGAALYDSGTGRPIRSYGQWHIVADDPDRGVLAAQVDSGGRLTLARLDLDTGRATVIGTTLDWHGETYCVWRIDHVACAGEAGIRIWQLP